MKKEDLNFTVLDVETSGLDPQNDQIIEFCMIRVRAGEPVLVFNSLVNFQKELNPKVTELTGHTLEDLAGGIAEDQLAYALDALIEPDECLIAYNAAFDLEFLEAMIARHVDPEYKVQNNFIDPLTIARDRFPFPHKLADTAARFGIRFEAHSAYEDTFALFDLVLALDKQSDITKYLNVLGYKTKYGKPTWAPPHAVLKVQDGNKNNNTGTTVRKARASAPKVAPKTVPAGAPADPLPDVFEETPEDYFRNPDNDPFASTGKPIEISDDDLPF